MLSFEFPGQTTPLILMLVGLYYGFVNGVVHIEDGTWLGALPGKLLRSA